MERVTKGEDLSRALVERSEEVSCVSIVESLSRIGLQNAVKAVRLLVEVSSILGELDLKRDKNILLNTEKI